MPKRFITHLSDMPTPAAGLALGVASLGWVWANVLPGAHLFQPLCALLAAFLLVLLMIKFIAHPVLLRNDLRHPVVGSVLPTFCMALMVISVTVQEWLPVAGDALWSAALVLHIGVLINFVIERLRRFDLNEMVPSWFIPPVGLLVAVLTCSENPQLRVIAHGVMNFSLLAYALLLPVMLYRLLLRDTLPQATRPTLAIMAAPGSLCLAAYLKFTVEPNILLVALLAVLALLMTATIYTTLVHLLRLPFTPGFAAFTFPMVAGASAQYALAQWMYEQPLLAASAGVIEGLAKVELLVATGLVIYVCSRFAGALLGWFEARRQPGKPDGVMV